MVLFVVFSLPGCATAPMPERFRFLGYDGNVNEHNIVIHASPSRVYSVLTDFDQFAHLVPGPNIRVTKITPGPISVGAVTYTETGYKIKIGWHSQVVEEQRDQMLIFRFLDGIFRGGYEIWELQPTECGTRASHTIVYNLSSFPYRVLWVLKGVEDKHNTVVEATLQNLKQHCERKLEQLPDEL
jgi:hypothetical protein